VAWSASAAHSAIAVRDRAPASTAHNARPGLLPAGTALPGGPGIRDHGRHRRQQHPVRVQRVRDGQQLANRGQSAMLTQRKWLLSSDPAGAGTVMMASGVVPAPIPAHIGVSQTSQLTANSGPLPTPCVTQRDECMG